MFKRNFPYSDIEVVVVEKQDILKTINDNIIDKEIALELIGGLEVKAESLIKEGKWTGIPYFGNIRIPKGLSEEVQDSYKDARQFAYATMNKASYIAFVKQIALDNSEKIKYCGYFNKVLAIYSKKDRKKFNALCQSKGYHYAACKTVFSNCIRPMKENYEYINEEEVENYDELEY